MPDGQDALAAWSVLKDCSLQVTIKNSSSVKGTLKTFLTLSWKKDVLSHVLEVSDDSFVQMEFGGNAWNGDSVQAAFQSLAKSADQNVWSEYTLALTESGKSENVQLTVKRDATKTINTAKFSAKELGFSQLAP